MFKIFLPAVNGKYILAHFDRQHKRPFFLKHLFISKVDREIHSKQAFMFSVSLAIDSPLPGPGIKITT